MPFHPTLRRLPTDELARNLLEARRFYTLFFSAEAQYAFTTVFAGLALTVVISPNIIFLNALVAGLCLLLIVRSFGIVNLPIVCTSFVAISAITLMIFEEILVLSPFFSAIALAMPVFV